MIDTLVDILSGGAIASIVGMIGGFLSRIEERKTLELKLNYEERMANIQRSRETFLAEQKLTMSELMGKQRIEGLEGQAFLESQKPRSEISEIIKACVRPIVLGILLVHTFFLYGALKELAGELDAFPAADIAAMYKLIVISSLSLTTMGVSWYFSQRSSKQFDKLAAHIVRRLN